MQLKNTITKSDGKIVEVVYTDFDDLSELGDRKVRHVHALCFCGDKMIYVYDTNKERWTPPGGGIEPGETILEAIDREVKEESNMKVLKHRLIGCQDIYESGEVYSQTRSVCIVEPYGEFVSDPDGDISKIAFVDPKDHKQYADWGAIGDHLVERAVEIKEKLEAELKQ